ncbi:MAG: proton-conducting transporter membrane subunit [Bacteroidales bacterium]
MSAVNIFVIIVVFSILLVPFLKTKWAGIVVLSAIFLNAGISGNIALQSLSGIIFNYNLKGSLVTGAISLQIDAISGWFILIINFIFITGSVYGYSYMKAYRDKKNSITLHWIAFILCYAALIALCTIQNSFVFLIAWEVLALSAFILVVFEHDKTSTIKAGINYLIQSHISILFLMLGFIWMTAKTGSYDFAAISSFSASHGSAYSVALFLCFFIGFAIKAGFLPFHTWLPYAHPAAPAHISGIMSGVIIKIGIFGILRMLLIIKPDFLVTGYFIMIISLLSGLYGVILAIVQHNLKKLLAYHSIENIGIIGLGIGIGCTGLGYHNLIIAALGFAGALLHTLNHALFKSLLFFASGNVYQAAHTLNIEHLGGLIKKMPRTAGLFLIAAIAICGIPPFNGFISEFIIYKGLYQSLQTSNLVSLIYIIFSILGLVLIGGLAMLCFTKAFGIVFLGTERTKLPENTKEVPFIQLLPLYIIVLFIVLIGIFPGQFIEMLNHPLNLLTENQYLIFAESKNSTVNQLQNVSWASWILILLVAVVFLLRKLLAGKRKIEIAPTWGCGYVTPSPKLQYTAASFVRTYGKLYSPFLLFFRKEKEVESVFPSEVHYETHPYDKIEKWLVDKPIQNYKSLMGKFLFLQNGKLQVYILYGIIFIISVISVPLIYEKVGIFIDFIKQL